MLYLPARHSNQDFGPATGKAASVERSDRLPFKRRQKMIMNIGHNYKQESRAIGRTRDAAVNIDTHRILQRHRAGQFFCHSTAFLILYTSDRPVKC